MDERDRPSERPTRSSLPDASGDGPATDSSAPELDARSVLLSIDSGGRPSLKLKDLDDDEPLPELQMGPEKYNILRELGAGGMGRVYLAYDQDLRRRVALKMVKTTGHEQVRRFLEEAQVMAQLDHPNIVPVFEVGLTEAKKPYYTMRVVRGRTLGQVLKRSYAGAMQRPPGSTPWPAACSSFSR